MVAASPVLAAGSSPSRYVAVGGARARRRACWPALAAAAVGACLLGDGLRPRPAARPRLQRPAFALPSLPGGDPTALAAGRTSQGRRAPRGYATPALRAAASAELAQRSEGHIAGMETIPASLNVAKNLVGAGVLCLPAAVAAFSSNAVALAPGLLVLAAMAVLSSYGFYLIGRVCEETGAETFGGAWRLTVERAAWLPQLVCLLECLGSSIQYLMVIGDGVSGLLRGTSLPAMFTARNNIIIAIGALILYPLSCLRSFASLAKFSALGTLATSYVVVFVVKRFLDGSYARGGAYFNKALHPVLSATGGWWNSKILILVSVLSSAFVVHVNAPQMYAQLTPNTRAGSIDQRKGKLSRFRSVTLLGFGIAALQYILVMTFGFLTFGRATRGNVLLNYATADPLAAIARVAVTLSVLFGFPMQVAGVRVGLLEAAGQPITLPKVQHRLMTAAMVAGAIGVACTFNDLGRFQALEGAFLATFVSLLAPPMMAYRLKGGRWAKARFGTLIAIGVGLWAIGAYVTLQG